MSENLVKQKIHWVDSNTELERICEQLADKKILAVDTEFMRSKTYYPIAGLIQINDGESNYLIDPISIDDVYPLVEILDSHDILKVMHSCSEDLEVFYHSFGCQVHNVFDTQIAAGFAGHGVSIGYGKLVDLVLDIVLPKNETRSDWLQRPLSQSQVQYAAIDVEYLYIVALRLIENLQDQNRYDWVLEDSGAILKNFFSNMAPDNSYQRFKSAWKLEPRQLVTLKALSRWREDLAQEKDLPRNRVLKESAVYGIAQQSPSHISQLRNFEGMNERMIRSYGKAIIDIVSDVDSISKDKLPERVPRPLSSEERNVLDAMKVHITKAAQNLSIPSELLMRKKDYESIIISSRDDNPKIPKNLLGWRKPIVEKALHQYLNMCEK